MPTHTGTEALASSCAGFTCWRGLPGRDWFYFFNLVNVPFMKQVDAGLKPKIFQYLTMPALQLFRWSAMLTVFVVSVLVPGLAPAGAHRMGVSAGSRSAYFFSSDCGFDDSLLRDLKTPSDTCWAW
jgi:hypothetical protein